MGGLYCCFYNIISYDFFAGTPSPQVVWYEGTHLIDSVMESDEIVEDEITVNATFLDESLSATSFPVTSQRSETDDPKAAFDGLPFNVLTLGPLTRDHLKTLLTCEASNNNITLPTSQVVMVDMNCKY